MDSTIKQAQILKRPGEGLYGKLGGYHYGAQVTTDSGKKYLIHSTPTDGTVVTDCNLSKRWSTVETITINNSKTVREVFQSASGRTLNKFINYVTSGSCIGTAYSVKSDLSKSSGLGGIAISNNYVVEGEDNLDEIMIGICSENSGVHLNFVIDQEYVIDSCLFYNGIAMSMVGHNRNCYVTILPDALNPELSEVHVCPKMIFNNKNSCSQLLATADTLLKSLLYGCILNPEKSNKIEFPTDIMAILREYKYKTIYELYELYGSDDGSMNRVWLSADKIVVLIKKDEKGITISPYVKLLFNYEVIGNSGSKAMDTFSAWMNENMELVTSIFPIFHDIRKLIFANILGKILQKHRSKFTGISLCELESKCIDYLKIDEALIANESKNLVKNIRYDFHIGKKFYWIKGGISLNNGYLENDVGSIKFIVNLNTELPFLSKFIKIDLTKHTAIKLGLGLKIAIDNRQPAKAVKLYEQVALFLDAPLESLLLKTKDHCLEHNDTIDKYVNIESENQIYVSFITLPQIEIFLIETGVLAINF
ncbi:hypothetical protein QJ857_gp0729 [Tupanvirus soda lake]|uniref:Uncharacterized protein n=2 Tax=Tupanvirus TaxID=2094720 RepID=A0A6N1NL70_9VIRU|nr:hypothetical protein QJ857_gp0729 [Tupanvirus soda lake]QKU35319.1 hypothetical protein [Tupanvirus soda lake]